MNKYKSERTAEREKISFFVKEVSSFFFIHFSETESCLDSRCIVTVKSWSGIETVRPV